MYQSWRGGRGSGFPTLPQTWGSEQRAPSHLCGFQLAPASPTKVWYKIQEITVFNKSHCTTFQLALVTADMRDNCIIESVYLHFQRKWLNYDCPIIISLIQLVIKPQNFKYMCKQCAIKFVILIPYKLIPSHGHILTDLASFSCIELNTYRL